MKLTLLLLASIATDVSAFIHWHDADVTSSHWSIKDVQVGPGEVQDMFFDPDSFDSPTSLSLKINDVWTDPRAFGGIINQAFAAMEDQSQLRMPNDSSAGVFVTGAALIAEGEWRNFIESESGASYLPVIDNPDTDLPEIEWRRQIKGTSLYECDIQVEFDHQASVSIPEPKTTMLVFLALAYFAITITRRR